MTQNSPLSCAEFEALIPDLLDGTLSPRDRERMDAHRLDCDECDSIAADLLDIRQRAANLPVLTPSRDLWGGSTGVESRIQTEVVQFPVTPIPGEVAAVVTARAQIADRRSQLGSGNLALRSSSRRFWVAAAAAVVLVGSTAIVTWDIAMSEIQSRIAATEPAPATGGDLALPARNVSMEESYDKEIADLRRIVDDYRLDMDSVTVAVLERNLKVIDDAIAESKAALAASPESAFLLARLNDAYATKLRTLRAVAVARRG